jgi:hypothetical protein
MEAYPTVSTFTNGFRTTFKATALGLFLMAATVCAYAKEPVTGLHKQPAPVKLSSFQAIQKSDSRMFLTWTTEQEINASHFVVERSYDGKTFTETGLVFTFDNSIGRNAYRFTDDLRKKHHAVVYYRLRIVDTDGKTENSAVVSFSMGK